MSWGTTNLVVHKQVDKYKPQDVRKEAFNADYWEALRGNFLEEMASYLNFKS